MVEPTDIELLVAEELAAQKSTYDAAFAAWSSGIYANALATREFFGFTCDNFAEQEFNAFCTIEEPGFVRRMFR